METGGSAPVSGVGERKFHDDPRLDAAVREVARAVARGGREPGRPAAPGQVATREVATEHGTFFVSCVKLREWPSADEVLVVTVTEPKRPELPDESELRKWFGLTRMEARVARMLAQGLTNAEIAQSQFISAHTARHHTESVLLKLGVHSRREVSRLLERPAGVDFAA